MIFLAHDRMRSAVKDMALALWLVYTMANGLIQGDGLKLVAGRIDDLMNMVFICNSLVL